MMLINLMVCDMYRYLAPLHLLPLIIFHVDDSAQSFTACDHFDSYSKLSNGAHLTLMYW